MILRKLVGSSWRVRSGHARTPTAPGRPYLVGATPGSGQATIRWATPRNGGSPLLRMEVIATPGGATVVLEPDVTQATITALTNGLTYTFVVRAVNAIGATDSFPSAPTVPGSATLVRPTVSNTGIPGHLPGDTRPALALTDAGALPDASWFTRDASRSVQPYRRFIIKAMPPGGLLERIDFTNWHMAVNKSLGGADGMTFRHCLFRVPNEITAPPSIDFPNGRPMTNICQIAYAAKNITFDQCVFDGLVDIDAFAPASAGYALSQGCENISFIKCVGIGSSNTFVCGDINGYFAQSNLSCDLTTYRPYARVRGVVAAAQSGGSTLPALTRYFAVAAVIRRTSQTPNRFFLTALHPQFSEKAVAMATNDSANISWQAYGNSSDGLGTSHVVDHYRVYVATSPGATRTPAYPPRFLAARFKGPLDPASYGYFTVPASQSSAVYTGQALTPGAPTADGDWNGPASHPDTAQLVHSYAKNVTYEGNDFFAFSPEGYSQSAGIQIGSLKGPPSYPSLPQPVVENLKYNFNWIDGSGTHFGINNRNPIQFITPEFRGNRIGRDFHFYNKVGDFQKFVLDQTPGSIWADNVWSSEGYTKTDRSGPYVLEGQIIP